MIRKLIWVLGILIAAPILYVGFFFVSYFFGAEAPMCQSSNPHFIWYTKDNECKAIEYSTCRRDTYNKIPENSTTGCTEKQKISHLQKLEGFQTHCRVVLDPPADSTGASTEGWMFFVEKAAVEACKPYISSQAYQKAITRVNE